MAALRKTTVLIVGAGPSGLMMAAQLVRFNISFIIIDKKGGPVSTSNAFGIQARSMEVFDQLGVAPQFLEACQVAESANYYTNGKLATQLRFKDPGKGITKFPNVFILEQFKTEELLIAHLEKQGEHILWDTALLGFEQKDSHFYSRVGIEDQDVWEIESEFLIGADGAGSTVRKNLNIPFEGKTFPQNFMLADGFLQWDNPHQNVSIGFSKSTTVGFFPFKEKNKYRIFSFMGDKQKPSGEFTENDIIEKVENQLQLDIKVKKLIWFSVFRIHSRIVERFSIGKCFLVGDSAHIHSPAGAQGMNNGFMDAHNLAWKIAFVKQGILDAQILDTYEKERKSIAQGLLKNTDNTFQFVISESPIIAFLRLKLLPKIIQLLLRVRSLRRYAFKRLSQIGISYPSSPFNFSFDKDASFKKKAPVPGERFPYILLSEDSHDNIFDLMKSPCFYLVYFGQNDSNGNIEGIRNIINSLSKPWIKLIDLTDYPVASRLKENWGMKYPTYFLIRPDMHIALRCQPAIGAVLQDFIRKYSQDHLKE